MSNAFFSIRKVLTLFFLLALLFWAYLAGPYWWSLYKYDSLARSGVSYTVPGSRGEIDFEETTTLKPASLKFGLVIPKIGLNKVVGASVDLYETDRLDDALDNRLVHMLGSSLPNRIGTVVVVGHSPSQLINFRHVNPDVYLVKKLAIGDKIYLYCDSVEYLYEVTGVSERSPTYFDFFDPARERKLILASGWPPGSSFRLLLVEAEATWD